MSAPDQPPTTGERRTAGWLFVAGQVALLIALAVLPRAEHWPVPRWLVAVGWALMIAGAVLVVVAARRLGPGLTPTPIPNDSGRLITTGLYRFSRHPIYSGVLAIVAGIVVRSGSLVVAAVGAVTAAFFWFKARWEEDRLRERYPDYDAYAAGTGRFLPRLRADHRD